MEPAGRAQGGAGHETTPRPGLRTIRRGVRGIINASLATRPRMLFRTTGLALLAALCAFQAGCANYREPGAYEACRVVDAVSADPLPQCAGVSLVLSQPWHCFRDPDEVPYGPWRVQRVQLLDGGDGRMWQSEYSYARGMAYVVVRHQKRGNVVFAPGYDANFDRDVGSSFYARPPAHPLSYEVACGTTTQGAPIAWQMRPLRPGALGAGADDGEFPEKALFVLQQQAMWDDLADRYRDGKDREAIQLICRSMVMAAESVPSSTMQPLPDAAARALNWCRTVADESQPGLRPLQAPASGPTTQRSAPATAPAGQP